MVRAGLAGSHANNTAQNGKIDIFITIKVQTPQTGCKKWIGVNRRGHLVALSSYHVKYFSSYEVAHLATASIWCCCSRLKTSSREDLPPLILKVRPDFWSQKVSTTRAKKPQREKNRARVVVRREIVKSNEPATIYKSRWSAVGWRLTGRACVRVCVWFAILCVGTTEGEECVFSSWMFATFCKKKFKRTFFFLLGNKDSREKNWK